MGMTQMNTRIDEDVKRLGDAAFAEVGFTPSRVVQVVWQLAAVDETFPRMLAQMAIPSQKTAEEQRREVAAEVAQRGANIVNEFFEKRGIPRPTKKEKLDYKKMLEEARLERYAEKGIYL